MELFFLFTDFLSKNSFIKIFSIQPDESKTYFTKYFPLNMKSPKQIIETGNRIIETGNGISFPTYRPLNKNFFSKIFSIQPEEIKSNFRNRK